MISFFKLIMSFLRFRVNCIGPFFSIRVFAGVERSLVVLELNFPLIEGARQKFR